MIRTTELRIGNRLWPFRVLNPKNIPLMGYSICVRHLAYSDEELNGDWEGIPLTPEIMEKCGFDVNGRRYHQDPLLVFDYNDKMAIMEICDKQEWEHSEIEISCKYLHQLQNLFFALTGEELKIQI
jgi:hypothetical protein